MIVHLVDGTYELFRYFMSPAAAFDRSAPEELRAVRGVVASVLGMLEAGATHLGVATDHVIESFRNALWPDYKTGEGIDPVLYAQFEPLEDALRALGVAVWAMVEFEADDALASGAAMAAADARVSQVLVCTPDKDLAQCVRGDRIVQLDRRTGERRDEAGVQQKFGVRPESIPDWLALVGDSADGLPRTAGLGEDIRGGGARALPAPGGDSGSRLRLGRLRPGRGTARRDARRAARSGDPVPRARHAAKRRAHRHRRRRAPLDGARARVRGLVQTARLGGAPRAGGGAGGSARGRAVLSEPLAPTAGSPNGVPS